MAENISEIGRGQADSMKSRTQNMKTNRNIIVSIRLVILLLCIWALPVHALAMQEDLDQNIDEVSFTGAALFDESGEAGEILEDETEWEAGGIIEGGTDGETGEIDESGLIDGEDEAGCTFNPYVFSVDETGTTASVDLQPELMDLESEEVDFLSEINVGETTEGQNQSEESISPGSVKLTNVTYNIATDDIVLYVNVTAPDGARIDAVQEVDIKGAVEPVIDGYPAYGEGKGFYVPVNNSTINVILDSARTSANLTVIKNLVSNDPSFDGLDSSPKAGEFLVVNDLGVIFTNNTNSVEIHTSDSSTMPSSEPLFQIEILQAPLNDSMKVTLSPDSYTYAGSPCTPTVSVETSSGKILKQNEDYKVEYKDNNKAGTASVIVTGIGDYSDSITKTFQINSPPDSGGTTPAPIDPPAAKEPASINASDMVLTAKKKAQTFNLGATTDGGALIYESSNAKNVSVDANGNVTVKKKFIGSAAITITAAGNDTHTTSQKQVVITINPPKTKLLNSKKSGDKKILVKWRKSSLSVISGYQIRLSRNKDFSSKVKKVTVQGSSKTSKTVTVPEKGKTYFIQVRTYKKSGNKYYYSAWSNTKKVKIPK